MTKPRLKLVTPVTAKRTVISIQQSADSWIVILPLSRCSDIKDFGGVDLAGFVG